MNGRKKWAPITCLSWLCFLMITLGPSCGGDDETTATAGRISLSLTDAATDEYNAVYVSIAEVRVHLGDVEDEKGWQTVGTPDATYNLLELVNGVHQNLGIADLPAGHYTQIRLLLAETPDDELNILGDPHPYANYILDESDEAHELKVPSGYTSGIKLVHGFDIADGELVELILDFDAARSVVQAGSSGKYILKPTIKVIGTEEIAVVSGTVGDGSGLEGVIVAAQLYDPDAGDAKDRVMIQASTVTDENGDYLLYLTPGTYTLVAFREGYTSDCTALIALASTAYTRDFTLATASTGTLAGEVSIAGGEAEQVVGVSVQKEANCGVGDVDIELIAFKIANGGEYDTALEAGPYLVVASTEGATTQEHTADIASGAETVLDISF